MAFHREPIEQLDLTEEAYDTLKRGGYDFIDQVESFEELVKINDLSKREIYEILGKVKRYKDSNKLLTIQDIFEMEEEIKYKADNGIVVWVKDGRLYFEDKEGKYDPGENIARMTKAWLNAKFTVIK